MVKKLVKNNKKYTKLDIKNWLKERYVVPEKEASEATDKMYYKYGQLLSSKKWLMAELLNRIYNFKIINFLIHDLFKNCSRNEVDFDKNVILSLVDGLNAFDTNVEFNGNKILVKSKSITLEAEIFSKREPNIKLLLPKIETVERCRYCHYNSIQTALYMDYCKNVLNKIVTGNVYDLSYKSRYLHSWVEFSENNKDMVLDPTQNIIIEKNQYYKLMHVRKTHNLSSNQIKADIDFINAIIDFDPLFLKVYLTDRMNANQLYNSIKELKEIQIEK